MGCSGLCGTSGNSAALSGRDRVHRPEASPVGASSLPDVFADIVISRAVPAEWQTLKGAGLSPGDSVYFIVLNPPV